MQLYLKQGTTIFRIPVLPAEYTVSGTQGNTTLTINGIGEINLLGKRGLTTLGFSSFFPYRYDSSYCEYSGIPAPAECVTIVENMKRGGTVNVVITGVPLSLDMSIESFEWGENDGTGDVTYTLSLKEYRKINIPMVAGVKRSGTSAASKQTSYTVKKGDCLSTIAKRLGLSGWKTLYNQNKGTIGSNPNLIKPGQVLIIPK